MPQHPIGLTTNIHPPVDMYLASSIDVSAGDSREGLNVGTGPWTEVSLLVLSALTGAVGKVPPCRGDKLPDRCSGIVSDECYNRNRDRQVF